MKIPALAGLPDDRLDYRSTILNENQRRALVRGAHFGGRSLPCGQYSFDDHHVQLGTKPLDTQDVLPPPSGTKYFADTHGQALSIVRTPAQVLAIVRPFFPHGLNGTIK